MPAPLFTVLLPVNRPPDLLPFAVESVLRQSEPRFELFIICDGPPRETVEVARDLSLQDARLRVFDCAKGERHGEAHRHAALGEASGRLVAQIGDDDLWFPDHLKELSVVLAEADFGNLLQAEISLNHRLKTRRGDLGDAEIRSRMLDTRWNFFGPTCAGYRLDAYRRLPEGWSPAPPEIYSDLHMWRKFLRCDGLSFATRQTVQAIKLSARERLEMTLGERRVETAALAESLRDPEFRSAMAAKAVRLPRHRKNGTA